jgi:hypothetical protein
MIMYTADPQELIAGMQYRETVQIKLPSGGYVNAESLPNSQIRIIEVISTDPMDFMYEQYQPGNIISN